MVISFSGALVELHAPDLTLRTTDSEVIECANKVRARLPPEALKSSFARYGLLD
jgi:hypothetical protein